MFLQLCIFKGVNLLFDVRPRNTRQPTVNPFRKKGKEPVQGKQNLQRAFWIHVNCHLFAQTNSFDFKILLSVFFAIQWANKFGEEKVYKIEKNYINLVEVSFAGSNIKSSSRGKVRKIVHQKMMIVFHNSKDL